MAPRGGTRPGAGRKKTTEKYALPIRRAEKQIVDRLPERVERLHELANGGFEQVTETYEPAGSVLLELPLRGADGQPLLDRGGRPILARQRAFPDLAADALICVRRVVSVAAPDRKANEYLLDRIMGRPTVAVAGEIEQTHKLPPPLEAMIAKVYGETADDGDGGGA